jgi:hypothetical protein
MAAPILGVLIDEVTQAQGVMASATVFINGVPGLIAAAIEQALRNGATETELAPLTALEAELEAQRTALAAALAANSPPGEARRR